MFTSLKHVWSVFISSIEMEFGVSRTISILPFSLLNIADIIGFLSVNSLKKTVGLKKLLIMINALMTLGLMLTSISPSITMLIISFSFIYGLGHGLGFVLAVSLGVKWSHKQESGIVTGLIVSAYSFGILILSPLTTYLIQSFSSWRIPLLIYCLAVFALMTVSMMLLEEPSPRTSEETLEFGLLEIAKTREFALIALMLFLTTLFDGLLVGNFVPLVREATGVDPLTASFIISTYSIVSLISRVTVGAVSERLGVFKTLITVYLIATVNASLFSLYRNIPLIVLGASISAVLLSTNVTLSPLIASLIWGPHSLEASYGLLLTAIVCGVLVGPVIGGLSKDLIGSYYPGIIVTALSLLLGIILAAYVAKRCEERNINC